MNEECPYAVPYIAKFAERNGPELALRDGSLSVFAEIATRRNSNRLNHASCASQRQEWKDGRHRLSPGPIYDIHLGHVLDAFVRLPISHTLHLE